MSEQTPPPEGDPPEETPEETPPEGGEETPPEDGNDGLRSALASERARREKVQRELDDLRKSHMSESEKALAEAKASGRAEALGEVSDRLLRAEVRAAAAGRLADPGDAFALIERDGLVSDDGTIDSKAVSAAIDKLAKDKPYLVRQAANGHAPMPQGQQAAGKPTTQSVDDFLRGHIRGARH